MKYKTLVASVIATACITLISCYWLFGKKPSAEKSIEGKWLLHINADTATNDPSTLGKFFIGMSRQNDSVHVQLDFRKDSIFYIGTADKNFDSSKYYLSKNKDTLFLSERQGFSPCLIKTWNDSTIQFYFDSSSVTLKK